MNFNTENSNQEEINRKESSTIINNDINYENEVENIELPAKKIKLL